MAETLVLVTGANGFIASRLIPRLLAGEYRVRALAREPKRLLGRTWRDAVDVRAGSTIDRPSVEAAMQGVHTAFYLIHSMSMGKGYMEIEERSAQTFAAAAEAAGLQHIIYVGGLADPGDPRIAPHMRSRIETGDVLRRGKVPVSEFRAGVIAGAGSISFEMIRFLTEFFPVLPGPTWLGNETQPISSGNVIDYLMAGLEREDTRGGIYEMGGPERMPYRETMLRYARHRRLKRTFLTLPGIPIWLMALFVDWLTPVPYPIATALIGGLQSDSRVRDDAAMRVFPEIKPVAYETAMDLALEELHPARLERVWEGLDRDTADFKHEGFIIDYRSRLVNSAPGNVFEGILRIAGGSGSPRADRLWRLHGFIDGPASDRGDRRSAEGSARDIKKAGDVVDQYSVDALEPGRLVRLHSVRRAPGEGWLEWRLDPGRPGECWLRQTAFFAPRGLPGFLYWFILGPLHRLVLRGLIDAIKQESEAT